MDSSILEITKGYAEDTRIKSYEYFPYLPITGTQYNTPSIIRIDIENQDEYFHPHMSWLQFDGKLIRDNDARYANEEVTITNDAISHLFTNIKYILGGNEIESLNNCGQATVMHGIGRYSKDYGLGPGLASGWYPDTVSGAADAHNTGFQRRKTYFVTSPHDNGEFSIPIYLDHFSGFAEDFQNVVYGMRHSLQLTRKATDADAIFRAAGVPVGKIVLSKITWWMPRVIPSETEGYKLYKQIQNDVKIPCAFRMRQCASINVSNISNYTWNLGVRTAPEKPRYVIIGFQTNKSNNQEANTSLFDHCQVTNMKVRLNSTEYPSSDMNADFNNNKFAVFYQTMLNFMRQYNGIERTVSSTGIDAEEYKHLFPLYFFDVTRQSERLNQSVVDISVNITFEGNTGANTYAYALLISDRVITFQSDGRKMNVIF